MPGFESFFSFFASSFIGQICHQQHKGYRAQGSSDVFLLSNSCVKLQPAVLQYMCRYYILGLAKGLSSNNLTFSKPGCYVLKGSRVQ